MSGRRKTAQSLEELPDEKSTHRIGRVTVLRGANQCDVEFDDKQTVMVLIPTKFHKMVWIKRGDFVIVNVYPSTKTDHKAEVKLLMFSLYQIST
jgi:initiation factor 1A